MYGNPIPPWNQPSDLEADHKRALRLARAILLPPRSPKGEPVFNSQSLNAEAIAEAVANHENFRRTSHNEGLGHIVLDLVAGAATLPMWAFLLFKYWQWFMEPLVHLPLSFGAAIGVRLLMRALVPDQTGPLYMRVFSPIVPDWVSKFIVALFGVPLGLLTGWIFYSIIS